ncbi:NADH-ubiquinone oxidoreductase 10.5 kDa subunit [Amylocarpus encephaloides]|uniref:NADH-ubiquinone oxidoreductase 10.5 kDa subunit n=1 Tax=Amylocarpus encephaloides TaxID=45428 RepID=A0A9P8C7A9_9HELO|nr:NADH-ubiquinone oxidoreductase 10.5 kDa subunit [Amylocarpus encephaloides]
MSAKYAFSQTLKEVRFLFCQTGEKSASTRTFLARAYPTMKKSNPNTPIMLREAAGTSPKVYARFGQSPGPHASPSHDSLFKKAGARFGQEKSESLSGLSDKEIEERVTGLVKSGI